MDDSNDPHAESNAPEERNAGLPGSVLDDDALFEALANERRRYLLYTLLEDDAWTLDELAGKVAAWETDRPVSSVDEADAERVYASLYHAHVPKLADLEIIEFDRRTETIAKGPNADQALSVLELTGESAAIALEDHARSENDD